MGFATCGMHGGRGPRVCWGCDRCPKCDARVGRLRRGDYCAQCTEAIKAKGGRWAPFCGNFVLPEDGQQTIRLRPIRETETGRNCSVLDCTGSVAWVRETVFPTAFYPCCDTHKGGR